MVCIMGYRVPSAVLQIGWVASLTAHWLALYTVKPMTQGEGHACELPVFLLPPGLGQFVVCPIGRC